MEIAEFLLARIAEDEAVAREGLAPASDGARSYYSTPGPQRDDWGLWLFHVPPERFLAECEAKRAMIRWFPGVEEDAGTGPGYLLGFLVLPYADHPDYEPAWHQG